MSRLDDELRAPFRRVEPPAGFAERVIGRINNPAAPKQSLWRKLKSFFEPPVARWVAVGVAASLLVAIFASQYTQIQEATPEQQRAPLSAEVPPVGNEPVAPLPDKRQAPPEIKQQPVKHRAAVNRNLLAQQRRERQHRLEAEQAKAQIMLALQIASTTLNEANKMVRGDD